MTSTVKNKKVAAGVGVAAVAAAALALGAGTYASFQDTDTDGGTTAAAGTLFFDNPVNGSQTLADQAPGEKVTRTLTFSNGGNQRGTYTLRFALTATGEGTPACAGGQGGPEQLVDANCALTGDEGELHDQTSVVVTASAPNENSVVKSYTDIDALAADTAGVRISAASAVDVTYTIEFTFKDLTPAENNKAQGDTFTVGTTATLERPI